MSKKNKIEVCIKKGKNKTEVLILDIQNKIIVFNFVQR